MSFRQGFGGLLSALVAACAVQAAAAPRPTLAEPSLSPDGAEIAFVSGGDIWTVPAAGGTASLLVTDPATEGRPLFSPDGRELAFTSTRNGSANIYVLTLGTGQVRRLTFSDANEQLDGWSRDGKWIYLSSPANDVAAAERHLPGRRQWRHAAGSQPRALPQRVQRRPLARTARPSP